MPEQVSPEIQAIAPDSREIGRQFSLGSHHLRPRRLAQHLINCLTSIRLQPRLEVALCNGHPTSGGVTASTEMLAAKRHAGVHTPAIACKTTIANQQMAYAA
jgi:hypothetical protein